MQNSPGPNPNPQESREEAFDLLKNITIRYQLDAADLVLPATTEGFQITPEIFISHYIPAHNREFLSYFGIKSILCLDGKLEPGWASQLGVEKIISTNMPDGPGTTVGMMKLHAASLHNLVEGHAPVLVQCNAGQSRSAAVVAGYLAMYRGMELSVALNFVKERRAPERQVKYWPETLEALREACSS